MKTPTTLVALTAMKYIFDVEKFSITFREVIKMDSPEAIANKGYETFAEHFVNEGIKQEREKNEARDSKRADYLRSQNVPENVISAMLALK